MNDETPDTSAPSLRERKRQRTRSAIVDTGRRLFEERGYDDTTVADIAAAADIGTRTFFAYFETKEHLLFSEEDPRVVSALDAIRDRNPEESPAEVLLRGLSGEAVRDEARNPVAQLRLRLLPHVPAIRARALRLQLDAQQQITAALAAAYPEKDPLEIAALVGAFIGAVAAAFHAADADPDIDRRHRRVRDAVHRALITPGG